MAYRAFDVGPFGLETATTDSIAATARFTHAEARVIALADSDRADSVGARSRLGRFIDRVFGIRRSNPLADPRLEALRRFAVLARLSDGRLPGAEIERFIAAGFTVLQARALQLRVAASRIFDN